MMPRLPVNIPRWAVAMMSPVGVTRFCSGILVFLLPAPGEKVGMRGIFHMLGTAENSPHPPRSDDAEPVIGRALARPVGIARGASTSPRNRGEARASRRAVADRRLE